MEEIAMWVIGIAVVALLLDTRKRVSQIGDRLAGYERQIEDLKSAVNRLDR
jgi:hypothetical protein